MLENGKPPRVIGLGGAVLLNLNGVIGAGIFALPAILYASAGTFAPVAILVFAVFYSCLAAIAAKLSTVFRQSGGPQLYAQHAFGPMAGFMVGWFILCTNMAGRAANFHVLVSYLAAIFPIFDGPIMRPATILLLVATFMMIGIVGTKRSIFAMWAGTTIKLAPLILLCVAGFGVNGLPSEIILPQFSEIETVAILLAYAFSGAGAATVVAGESKEPRRTIMRSIYLNIAIVAILYATIQLAYIVISPDPAQTESPLAAAGYSLLGPVGALIISLAAIFSIATNQLSNFVAMPRIAYGMGRRGLLPNIFTYVSPRFETPAAAIAIYSGIVAVLAMSGTFEILITLGVAVEQLILFIMVGSLLIMWKRNDGGIADEMGLRWALIIPVAVSLIVWLTMQVPASAVLSTSILIVFGLLLYGLSKRRAVQHEPVLLPEKRGS
ncbi:APC family permease [Qipengyuania sp. 1XM1-15A]|uniref:APC family permease n=1 Tax=Qipengyuania xiamenensis TaxID=2867237 RepID=UPI001C86B2B7|nr:APC family permease [Qipengyuania xiamenensis]MBX7531614.1 APC family permease [Qipengyuania xiamenensis]